MLKPSVVNGALVKAKYLNLLVGKVQKILSDSLNHSTQASMK